MSVNALLDEWAAAAPKRNYLTDKRRGWEIENSTCQRYKIRHTICISICEARHG